MHFKAIPRKHRAAPAADSQTTELQRQPVSSEGHGQPYTEKAKYWRPKLEFLSQWGPFS